MDRRNITLWWQHIPEMLDPIAYTIGFFSLYWYAVFFLVGFCVALMGALWATRYYTPQYSKALVVDVLSVICFGALLGGHIGYIGVYASSVPISHFLPYDVASGRWRGVSWMSYHGGLIGGIIALFWFTRFHPRVSFWKMADFCVLFVPIVTFFGRLGNFFNVELYGRITHQPWGMIFPDVIPIGALRHPSTLYEAILEGVVLFVVLLVLRKKVSFDGALTLWYMVLYAIVRFVGEMFREPDGEMGFFFGVLTLGQVASVAMICFSGILFVWLRHQKRGTIV